MATRCLVALVRRYVRWALIAPNMASSNGSSSMPYAHHSVGYRTSGQSAYTANGTRTVHGGPKMRVNTRHSRIDAAAWTASSGRTARTWFSGASAVTSQATANLPGSMCPL
ncbi:hypothetical protein ACFQ1S_05950 [Kibdelosporangium lantanae]|uniref:Secreted protein n=1 Tax=Kibdelosporangium lantanae TaxID=1497396 RepID=A0ABW3M3A1_9PSEU